MGCISIFRVFTLLKKRVFISNFYYFCKDIYPLSIFWLQIKFKTKEKLLPIDSSMTTSQLWFNILPVLASFITVILSVLNTLLYVTDKLI